MSEQSSPPGQRAGHRLAAHLAPDKPPATVKEQPPRPSGADEDGFRKPATPSLGKKRSQARTSSDNFMIPAALPPDSVLVPVNVAANIAPTAPNLVLGKVPAPKYVMYDSKFTAPMFRQQNVFPAYPLTPPPQNTVQPPPKKFVFVESSPAAQSRSSAGRKNIGIPDQMQIGAFKQVSSPKMTSKDRITVPPAQNVPPQTQQKHDVSEELKCPSLTVDFGGSESGDNDRIMFTLRVAVSGMWRERYAVSTDDMMKKCVSQLKVRKYPSGEIIKGCPACNASSVVSVGCSSKELFGPHLQGGDVEVFCCDNCVAHCESSSNHLGGDIYLSLENLPEMGQLRSQPFSLAFARQGGTPSAANKASPSLSPRTKQQTLGGDNASFSLNTAQVEILPPLLFRGNMRDSLPELAFFRDTNDLAIVSAFNRLIGDTQGPSFAESSILTYIWEVHLDENTVHYLMKSFLDVLKDLVGFSEFTYSLKGEILLTVTSFSSLQSAKTNLNTQRRFIQNRLAINNGLGINLEEAKYMKCLCVSGCW